MLAAFLIVAALVWLMPGDGPNIGPGQLAPTASAGPDRLGQDLQDLRKPGAALSRKLLAVVLTLVLAGWLLQGCAPSDSKMT